MLKKIFILSILHVFVIFLYSQSAIERLQKDVIILSSDSFEGRLPFSRGDSLATNYILEEFHKQQLTLYNNTGKQEISFPHQRIILPSELIINETSYQFKRDFIPYSFSKNTKFESDAIFAGYGLFVRTKDSILINHFANADVKGRWVIMFDGKPDGFAVNPSQYKVFTKCSNARILGAKGVILVSNQNILPEQNTKDLFELPFPVINITHDVFIDICKLNNLDYEQLIQQINQKIFFEAIPLHCTIKANVQIKTLDGKSNNIIGITTGSDPKLKEEYIVVGAHFDHLGSIATRFSSTFINEIHNGADDNASGVAGMLELMRLVQQMPTKRSIIWVAFAAEEKGLLGSKYFVENPPVSLKNIVAMINLDMIGRLDSISQTLSISGTGTSKIFKKLIQKHAKKFSFNISNNPSGEGPSDHASFYRKNIPVLFIHSGLHEDYHKPTDDADKINFIGMKSIVDFTYLILADIANYPHKIKFSKTKSYQNSEREHKEVKFTLGIIPDVTGSTEGLLVEGVKADGIADKSGIKKGDIIIAINDKPIKNIYDYMNRLNEVENEKTIKIKINRNGQIKEITARVY